MSESRLKPLFLDTKGLSLQEDVRLSDRVWDGVEFCSHGDTTCNGIKEVVGWAGLSLTPDHEVLTDGGWKEAKTAKAGAWRPVVGGAGGTPIRTADHSNPYCLWKLSSPLQFGSQFLVGELGDKCYLSSIRDLLFSRGPSAIVSAIRSVYVDSVKRISWPWSLSHVGQKVLELFPSFANSDPSSAIAGIRTGVWVSTPVKHVLPAAILRASLREAVSNHLCVFFGSVASAASALAPRQRTSSDIFGSPAIALACPICSSEPISRNTIGGALQHYPSSKTRASQISDFHYADSHIEPIDNNSNIISHNNEVANSRPFRGETMCISAWAERIGLPRKTLEKRLNHHGFTVEEALTLPLRARRAIR
jgi:hypothetical protein